MDVEIIVDQELSFITDIDDNDSEEEKGDEGDKEHDTVDHVIRSTMAYSRPILDETIDFTKPPSKISDLDD